MSEEINKINVNATRNLGSKLLKYSLKINALKAVNGVVRSKILSGKIEGLNTKKSELLMPSVKNVISENQSLLNENEQLKENLAKTEDLLRKKEQFFDIMAHDLKNPLGGIAGFCDLISALDDVNEIKESIGVVSRSANGALNLVVGLNELRRANSGKLMPSEFKLRDIVQSVFEIAKSGVDLNQVSLMNSISGDLSVKADKRIVEIVIRNLVSNAIKFTNSGHVELRATSVNGSPVQISVIDTGVGISKETMDKLLLRGDFVTTVSTRGSTGTGFGIPLCKDFVGLLGGKFWGESEEGKGTTFTFTIPKIKDQLLMAKI